MIPGPDNSSRSHQKVTVTIPRFHLEAACNYINENIAEGLMIEDDEISDTVGVVFYLFGESEFVFRDSLIRYLNEISEEAEFDSSIIRIETIPETSWVEEYQKSIKPSVIDNRLIICPPWYENDNNNLIDIVIEPRMAFGTGSHETTQLCSLEILNRFKEGDTFLDLGCGSGILSILAARLGAKRVTAVDIDPEAVANAVANTEINGVQESIVIYTGSIEDIAAPEKYDFVAANIMIEVIEELIETMLEITYPRGILVLSGILDKEEERLLALLSKYSAEVESYKLTYMGEWLAASVIRK